MKKSNHSMVVPTIAPESTLRCSLVIFGDWGVVVSATRWPLVMVSLVIGVNFLCGPREGFGQAGNGGPGQAPAGYCPVSGPERFS